MCLVRHLQSHWKDIVLYCGIFLFLVLSRSLFWNETFIHWDECLFEAATREYNVTLHQPHPPGYPLYIALGKLLLCFTGDRLTVFQLLNTVAYGASGVLFFVLSRYLFSTPYAISLTALLMASPLFWSTAGSAHVYSTEVPFLLLCWLAVFSPNIKPRWLLFVVTMTILTGIRPQSLFLFLPFTIYFIWKENRIRGAATFIIFPAIYLAWYATIVYFSDSWAAVSYAFSEETAYVFSTSVFERGVDGIISNIGKIFFSLAISLNIMFIFFIAGLWFCYKHHRQLFIAATLWMGPGLIFFTFIHIDKPAYIISILPAFYLVGGYALHQLLFKAVQFRPSIIRISAVALIGLMLLLESVNCYDLHGVNLQRTVNLRDYISEIRRHFSPENTVIVGRGTSFYLSWHHLRIYLEEYRTVILTPQVTYHGPVFKSAYKKKVQICHELSFPKQMENCILLGRDRFGLTVFRQHFDLNQVYQTGSLLYTTQLPVKYGF